MKIVRKTINLIFGAIAFLAIILFIVDSITLIFILTGQLTPGEPMFYDATTPETKQSLFALLIYILIILGCITIRTLFGKKYDFKFLRPKK